MPRESTATFMERELLRAERRASVVPPDPYSFTTEEDIFGAFMSNNVLPQEEDPMPADTTQRIIQQQCFARRRTILSEQAHNQLRYADLELPTNAVLNVFTSPFGDRPEGYAETLAQLFQFFRTNSDGRYSSSSLMALNRLPELYLESPDHREMPDVTTISMPFSYDPDTERKFGGLTGALVTWPSKSMIAVNRGYRRKKIGSMLLTANAGRLQAGFWVHRRNVEGQKFLLSAQMYPTALNAQGAVRYCMQDDDEGTAEGNIYE